MLRFRFVCLFLCSFLMPAMPAAAQTFSGLWWDTNRAGEGISIQQDGNNFFLVWYAYGTSGSPIWYAGSATAIPSATGLVGTSVSGSLFAFSATAASNTAGFSVTSSASVGTFTLTLTSETQLSFQAATSAALGTLPLTLQPYNVATPDATGTFSVTVSELASTCSTTLNPSYSTTYTITQSGSAITLVEASTSSTDSCTLVASSSTVLGNTFTFPTLRGTCTGGDSVSASNATLTVTAHTMILNAVSTVTSSGRSCTVTSRVAGGR